jgi:hypothetical protein
MSDYWNRDFDPLNPEDPYRRNAKMDPDARAANTVWGWIVAAVFVAVVLAVAFGMIRQPGQLRTDTAANGANAPAATHMAPSAMAPPAITPQTTVAATPISPAPSSATPAAPTQPGGGGQ